MLDAGCSKQPEPTWFAKTVDHVKGTASFRLDSHWSHRMPFAGQFLVRV